ncbi:MAG: FMN-binding protein [Clostridia bacterium]|nr:FMN-binding protein [Clostridia bacterium]
MMKARKIIIPVIAAVVLVGAVVGFKMLADFKTYKNQVSEITINPVDLSKVKDGAYDGHSEVIWVSADVKVTVADHSITAVQLVNHKNGRGKPAEVIPEQVVKAQSLEVDIVSGATTSSKVILKAIENALSKGLQ